MKSWSLKFEEDLTLLIKDWLKHKGKTQADLSHSLNAESTRMPALLDVLKKEFSKGGMSKLIERLCIIEEDWSINIKQVKGDQTKVSKDPLGQLDLLIEEILEDCPQ